MRILKYILREIVYLFIMIYHRAKCNSLIFEYRAKATKQSQFEGHNKLSHHSFFSGNMGFGSYIGASSIVIGKIGRFCSIAENVHFITMTHPVTKFVSSHPCFYSTKKQSGFSFVEENIFNEEPTLSNSNYSIEVGNDVYIGYGVTIVGPVKIGDGAVIAAGAVVTKDVNPYTLVGGVPAKKIKDRFEQEKIELLLQDKWWNKDISWIKNNADSFKEIELYLELIAGKDM